MEKYIYKIIPLAEISREFYFVCRHSLEDSRLAESVARRGVLKPVLMTGSSRQIVSGHKRFLAAEKAGLKEIPAFLMTENPPDEDLYLLSVFLNWNQVWNDLDRTHALHRAAASFHLPEKTLMEEILPALGLEPSRHFLEEYLETARLEASVLEAVSSGLLPFRGARTLNRFSPADQKYFAQSIVSRAAFTTSQLLKTVEWLLDLIKLKRIKIQELSLPASTDRRQSGEKFYAALRALRFPELARKEKEFESIAGKIEAEQSFELEPPAFFEGEGVVLRTRLASPEAVDQLAETLRQKRKLFNSLFDIML